MDKANGHLTYLKYDLVDDVLPTHQKLKIPITDRIEHIKALVLGPEPTEYCHEPIPDGKSGNMKLATGCSYCQFKEHCYPEMRVFSYAYGPKYLCKVVNEPRVREFVLDETGF